MEWLIAEKGEKVLQREEQRETETERVIERKNSSKVRRRDRMR